MSSPTVYRHLAIYRVFSTGNFVPSRYTFTDNFRPISFLRDFRRTTFDQYHYCLISERNFSVRNDNKFSIDSLSNENDFLCGAKNSRPLQHQVPLEALTSNYNLRWQGGGTDANAIT
ncbi:hypothetical protein J6590_050098 [Homalodisca vitripennis]|nr:hypothetical protein J6590_050098 [Homalodisca vitripennis]